MDFEWDYSKEVKNIQKHGIAFAEAVECFFDPRGISLEDKKHLDAEDRFYWIGKSASGRVLTTRYTRRGSRIRIIGCAEWRKFRELYNEATKTD